MMEFMFSRVCMSVCGLILLSAILIPVTGMYDSQARNMESDVSESIARLIDDFHRSELETFVIPASDILPGTSSYVEINGQMITLTTDRGVHRSAAYSEVISSGVFRYDDIIRMSNIGEAVMIEKM